METWVNLSFIAHVFELQSTLSWIFRVVRWFLFLLSTFVRFVVVTVTYMESMFGRVSIKNDEDPEYTRGSLYFSPVYTFYIWNGWQGSRIYTCRWLYFFLVFALCIGTIGGLRNMQDYLFSSLVCALYTWNDRWIRVMRVYAPNLYFSAVYSFNIWNSINV